ncbi:MAG: glycosyltransferase family 9 protein [Planctomycetota bacterium]
MTRRCCGCRATPRARGAWPRRSRRSGATHRWWCCTRARATSPGRRWPVDRFAALGKALIEELEATIVVTGGERERDLALAAAQAIGGRALSLAGKLTLQELIELVAQCDLLVSNDTAPVHLAGAVLANVIALYGPNTPLLYGPVHARGRAIHHALPCSPCLTNMNMKSSSCRMPACVLGIEVEEVMREARRLLSSSRARPPVQEEP